MGVGSLEDWKEVQSKCQAIAAMDIGLDFWLKHLMPIIQNIVDSVKTLKENDKNDAVTLNKELTMFWDSIYRFNSGSGGSVVNGWAKSLFPYLNKGQNNEELDWTKQRMPWSGASPGDFPASFSRCPMKWSYLGKNIKCGMYGGILGIAQQKGTGCIAPVIGWIVG